MGISSEGVFIRIQNHGLTFGHVARHIFKNVSKGTSEYSQEYNIGYADSVHVEFHQSGIHIVSSSYTNKFFGQLDYAAITALKTLCPEFEYALAYMQYDTAGAYGYHYIDPKGNNRLKYQHHDGITREYGDPLNEELTYLNAKYYRDENEDNMIVYELADTPNKMGTYQGLLVNLTWEVMNSKIGMDPVSEAGNYKAKYFKILNTPEISSNENNHRVNVYDRFKAWFK